MILMTGLNNATLSGSGGTGVVETLDLSFDDSDSTIVLSFESADDEVSITFEDAETLDLVLVDDESIGITVEDADDLIVEL